MSVVKLLFCTNPMNPLSWAIRACSWSAWSHVALVDGDSVIEAVAPNGVVRTALADRIRRDPAWSISALPSSHPDEVISAAASQIGKPYDYAAVLGLGLHRVWQNDERWFCSELAAWSFQKAGSPLFRADAVRRVTPGDL